MTVRILTGDCRQTLATLADGSSQMCVTSPPYFGLRDYGHAKQIGLESTPDAYVAQLVAVFREVRRVLKDDGTLWLNLGDSYARSTAKGGSGPGKNAEYGDAFGMAQSARDGSSDGAVGRADRPGTRACMGGLDAKQLLGIPWRVAFALQADGWYLRSDIIWHKPNPMPESVTDRPTKSHEYLFLLAKSERYYYDDKAIREAQSAATLADGRTERGARGTKGEYAAVDGNCGFSDDGLRNKRTVWTVNTQPFKGAHFATFPPALIEPCILAGSARGDTVLDPFGGAGTTGLVADRLGRHAILCELNPDYVAMADARIHGDNPLFSAVR